MTGVNYATQRGNVDDNFSINYCIMRIAEKKANFA